MNNRKGIILAGGTGSRLHPITLGVSKQLLPVFDKPMIYYPISCLMLAGIREILIITTPHDLESFERLLGDGGQWGLAIEYKVQEVPNGIAQAFVLGADFIGNSDVALILGDNLFHGHDLQVLLQEASMDSTNTTIFAQQVQDPHRYGVAEMDGNNMAVSIEEKPKSPKSNLAVTGCYFYNNDVLEEVARIKPSARGEYEISDLNQLYIESNRLKIKVLGRGFAWFDTGTHDSLLEAGQFVSTLQRRQGLMIACPEEIAYRSDWIDDAQMNVAIDRYRNNHYGKYLSKLLLESSQ